MRVFIATLAASVLAACATPASFEYTHKGEDVGRIDYQGRKVAAVVTGAGVNQSMRVDAENVLARELSARGMQGVAGHSVVPMSTLEPMTRERAIGLLRQAGVAGVVVLKLVDTEKKTVSTQWASTDYRKSVNNYNYFGPIGKEGDSYDRKITTITIETTLYNLDPYTVLWAGQSQSVDPAKVGAFIPQFARSVGDELRRVGLVK
ncbi:MAG: hypothetical protein IH606_15380 [Burkholderiales bacterium]|nr:hypothetical protein [Burkholderiales bacterium]